MQFYFFRDVKIRKRKMIIINIILFFEFQNRDELYSEIFNIEFNGIIN